ncbi:MAG: Hsp20/alpha crystallin family protein [Candidatus Helarchaeota archaeon]|nr:Hsp20/alpha crystallin family protein [Candidatus Helarchaeota archaeon]
MFDDEEDKYKKKKKRKRSFDDILDEIKRVMEDLIGDSSVFDEIFDEKNFPKFKTPSGDEIFRPLVMGWSVHIDSNGRPVIRKFGHSPKKTVKEEPLEENREPIIDILNQDNEIVIIAETPGVKKEDIKLKSTETEITIKAGSKFKKTISLPEIIIPSESKANYNNGLLEVRLLKKKIGKTDKTTINIE